MEVPYDEEDIAWALAFLELEARLKEETDIEGRDASSLSSRGGTP